MDKVKVFSIIGAVSLIITIMTVPCPAGDINIDWTKSTGEINRGIFSTQGFMQVYDEPNPLVMKTFELINPMETHTRLETYMHKMEPENDNSDPNVFNWDKLHDQQMIRFINDRNTFEKKVRQLGMEPLSLLCYEVAWNRSGDPDNPIKNIAEWVEYATAVVQAYNGTKDNYKNNLRYVEVWNEPNMKQFYTGNMESYFKLYNETADRIHRDYPGVMVGGPALTHAPQCAPDEWMEEFLKECGPKSDYISWHSYGESMEKLISDIRYRVGKFRKIPGKENGKMMMTETDFWVHGWPKVQLIMERQFRFLDVSDLILSIHHFCCMEYNESGNYAFGIVTPDGGVLGGTFWPYWLFRNLIGEQSHVDGYNRDDLDIIASYSSADNKELGTAVFHNRSDRNLPLDIKLKFPAAEHDRVLTFAKVTSDFEGIDKVFLVPAGEGAMPISLNLAPGEGHAVTLQDSGRRYFAFRDLNNQEKPWLDNRGSKGTLSVNDSCELEVGIVNTNFKPITGKLAIRGLPEDWNIELISGRDTVKDLGFGGKQKCTFRFSVDTVIPSGRISPHAVFIPEGQVMSDSVELAYAVPETISLIRPILTQVVPMPVHAVPGEINQVALQMKNQLSTPIKGRFEFIAPTSFELPDQTAVYEAPDEFDLPGKSMKRYQFKFRVKDDAGTGPQTGKIILSYMGTNATVHFNVDIAPAETNAKSVPLDISRWINFDANAFYDDREDYNKDMGMFTYPADYTPSDRIVNIRGVSYRMASLEDGKDNVILPQGQKIEVPAGKYSGAAFMSFGHDGKHHGDFVLHYTDGSSRQTKSQIPEWCTPPPPGFKVAFTAPHRYVPGGPALPPCELFTTALEADVGKKLKAIELPTFTHAYIYAITLLE